MRTKCAFDTSCIGIECGAGCPWALRHFTLFHQECFNPSLFANSQQIWAGIAECCHLDRSFLNVSFKCRVKYENLFTENWKQVSFKKEAGVRVNDLVARADRVRERYSLFYVGNVKGVVYFLKRMTRIRILYCLMKRQPVKTTCKELWKYSQRMLFSVT